MDSRVLRHVRGGPRGTDGADAAARFGDPLASSPFRCDQVGPKFAYSCGAACLPLRLAYDEPGDPVHPAAVRVGLSNVSGTGPGAVAVVAARHPGWPLVGHKSGANLDIGPGRGFVTVGPLRLWLCGRGDVDPGRQDRRPRDGSPRKDAS